MLPDSTESRIRQLVASPSNDCPIVRLEMRENDVSELGSPKHDVHLQMVQWNRRDDSRRSSKL